MMEINEERKKRQKQYLEEQQKRKEAVEEADSAIRLKERRNTRRQLDQQRYQKPHYRESREFQQNRLSPVIARNPARSPPYRPKYRQEDRQNENYAPSPHRFEPHKPSSSHYRRSKSPEHGIRPERYQERYPLPMRSPSPTRYNGYRRDPECSRAPRHHEQLRYTPYSRSASTAESRSSRRSSEDRQLALYDDRRMNSPRRRRDYRDPPTSSTKFGFRRDRSRERMEQDQENRASKLGTRRNDRFSEEPRICVILDPENFDYDTRPLSPPRPELFNNPSTNNRFLQIRIKDEPMRIEEQHRFFPSKKKSGPPPDGNHFNFSVSKNSTKQPYPKKMNKDVRRALPELSLRANCQMKMFEKIKGRTWRCIKLVGSPEAVINAQKIFNNWILDWQATNGAKFARKSRQNGVGCIFVVIPDVARQALFGNKLRMLKKIKNDNKLLIERCKSVEAGPPIRIKGNVENVRQAYKDVLEVIEKAIEEQ